MVDKGKKPISLPYQCDKCGIICYFYFEWKPLIGHQWYPPNSTEKCLGKWVLIDCPDGLCPICKGKGWKEDDKNIRKDCNACDGSGLFEVKK